MNGLHPLPTSALDIPSPERFPYPFVDEVHPLCRVAADELIARIQGDGRLWADASKGKMLGVLVVEKDGQRSYLAAFSGTLCGQTKQEGFVPPVFDLMQPGCHFQVEQRAISALNAEVEVLNCQLDVRDCDPQSEPNIQRRALAAYVQEVKAAKERRQALRKTLNADEMAGKEASLIRESQFMKAELARRRRALDAAERAEHEHPLRRQLLALQEERARRSAALQTWLFEQFVFLNARGERKSLPDIFAPALPPGGAGECCAPKLLQYAYLHQLRPLCLAEVWVGASPQGELRTHGRCYAPCRSRCLPILRHMLTGLDVAENPMLETYRRKADELREVYRDDDILVVSKPSGLLSVPGTEDDAPSVYDIVRRRHPEATGPLIVHRLDMDTSGLMVVALNEASYHRLQDAFLAGSIHKTYTALLEREMTVGDEGVITLPLRPDFDDRPRQMVDYKHGKRAVTRYRVVANEDGHARVELQPLTGRTHQLRVHCAHPDGMGNSILGDRLYGNAASAPRLMLHAWRLTIDELTFTDEYGDKT